VGGGGAGQQVLFVFDYITQCVFAYVIHTIAQCCSV